MLKIIKSLRFFRLFELLNFFYIFLWNIFLYEKFVNLFQKQ